MERTEKCFYEAPVTEVFEVRQEAIVCASGGAYPQWEGENI